MVGWTQRLGFLAMTLVALVVAHNLVFLLAYGAQYEEALAHTGHGGAWEIAVLVILASAAGLFSLAIWRLYRLGLLASGIDPAVGRLEPASGAFLRGLVWLWLRLTVATAALFVIQENFEHLRAGVSLPGLSVLRSAEYPDAAFVIATIAAAVACVGSLVGWRRAVLVARIAAALRGLRLRPLRALARPIADVDRRPKSIGGRRLAVRAPPLLPVDRGRLRRSA